MSEFSTPAELKVEYDDAGGVLRDISQYVLAINGVPVEQILQEISGFSQASERVLPIGKERVGNIELSGVFRTGANKPHELFHRSVPETPDSPSRTLKITWQAGAGGAYTSMETYVAAYNRTPNKNELTAYSATLGQAGQRTEGTNP